MDGGKLWEQTGQCRHSHSMLCHRGHAAAPLLPMLPALLSIPIDPSVPTALPSSWPFPAMLTGRRAAIGALMHPCRNAWKPKSGAQFSLNGSAGKMSFPIHRGDLDELIWRPGITTANPLLGVGARLQLTRAVESGCSAEPFPGGHVCLVGELVVPSGWAPAPAPGLLLMLH